MPLRLTATPLTATPLTATGGAPRPLLLLGPSLGTSGERLWGPVAPLLSDVAHLTVWDLPGHGRSPATSEAFTVADLADAVTDLAAEITADREDVTSVLHAGVSLGGATSLQIGLRHPGSFAALAMFCSGAKLGTPHGWRERAALVREQGTAAIVDGSRQRWFAPGFAERRSDVAEALLADLATVDDESYARCCEALALHDLTDRLGGVTGPVVAVAGDQDAVAPPEMSDAIAEAAQNARSITLPGVAHLAPSEDPTATATVLRELLGATSTSSRVGHDARKDHR